MSMLGVGQGSDFGVVVLFTQCHHTVVLTSSRLKLVYKLQQSSNLSSVLLELSSYSDIDVSTISVMAPALGSTRLCILNTLDIN